MKNYPSLLKYDPLPKLLAAANKAIAFFTERDLMDNQLPVQQLWQLPPPLRIIRHQQKNGSWKYPGANSKIRSQQNYDQLETYRNLGELIEKYGFDKRHTAIPKAAEFMLSFQSKEGDLRGIYGNQYTPNYTAAIMELFIKAGFEDHRIEKGFQWLLSIRQNDGGWAIPLRTVGAKLNIIAMNSAPIMPDKNKPFSHLATGVVLRAFAAHNKYHKCKEAKKAGELLISKLFKQDNYPDRGTADYWLRCSFPFWFTDLISALDSLSLLGFSVREPQIQNAVNWFVKNQQPDGLWNLKIVRGKDKETNKWLALAIGRILKRFE
jgi:hypothetical protein